MGMCMVFIDYKDSNPPVYERMEIRRDSSVAVTFDSGDPIVDWIDFCRWLSDEGITCFMSSSSVDHFFMDGAPYTNLYVDHSNDENVAFTTEQVIDGDIDTDELAEYIINDDIKTFEELRAYYKKHKKKAKRKKPLPRAKKKVAKKKVARKKAKKKVAKKKVGKSDEGMTSPCCGVKLRLSGPRDWECTQCGRTVKE